MPPSVNDPSFETIAGWTFTGTGEIRTAAQQISFATVGAQDGTHFAKLQAWTGAGVTAATMTGTIDVSAEDVGFWRLDGYIDGGEDGFGDYAIGPVWVDVYLDGFLWAAHVLAPWPFAGHPWSAFDLPAILLTPGTHSVRFVAGTTHANLFGEPYPDSFKVIVLLDNLSFVTASSGIVLPGSEVLRLTHASGRAKWETDGEVVSEWAGGIKRVSWPLAVLTTAPSILVGQDPATNRPAYCPAPDQPASGSTPTPSTTGSTCVLARCGAAVAMETHLDDLYKRWQYFINTGLSLVTTISVGVLLNWLLGVLAAIGLAESSLGWLLTVFTKVKPLLAVVPTLTAMASVLPDFDATTIDNIRRVFFAALQCDAATTTVTVSAADMANVAGYIRANPSSFLGDIVAEILAGCVEFSALGDWQTVIQGSVDSHLCDGY